MEKHKPYLIALLIHKGHNLPKADTIGKIDGYVKVRYGHKKTETKVVEKDYSPKWNKTFGTTVKFLF
jgi:Ca2+-dependent lipid-binding protein